MLRWCTRAPLLLLLTGPRAATGEGGSCSSLPLKRALGSLGKRGPDWGRARLSRLGFRSVAVPHKMLQNHSGLPGLFFPLEEVCVHTCSAVHVIFVAAQVSVETETRGQARRHTQPGRARICPALVTMPIVGYFA